MQSFQKRDKWKGTTNIIYQYTASGLTGLFTGQYKTEDYGTFTGVKY